MSRQGSRLFTTTSHGGDALSGPRFEESRRASLPSGWQERRVAAGGGGGGGGGDAGRVYYAHHATQRTQVGWIEEGRVCCDRL